MRSEPTPFIDRQRRLASHWGLALLVLSPLFFFRPLEDAYVLPQRVAALVGLMLAFAGLGAQNFNRSRLLLLALLTFAWRLFTHMAGPGPGASLPWVVEQLAPLGALLLLAHAARLAEWQQRLLGVALVSVGVVAAYALVQLWGWDPWERGAVDMGFLQRAHGSLGNPDFLAGFLVLAVPGLVLLWAAADGVAWGPLSLALLVTLTLLLTHVRGAWLAAAVSVPVALLAARARWRWPRVGVALALLLGLLALSLVPGRFNPSGLNPWTRLRQGWSGDGAWASRRFMARVGWDIAKTHPILGVGPGRFQNAFLEEQGRLLNLDAYAAEPYRFTADIHDDWVQSAAESGLPGLALLLAVWALALRAAWRRASLAGAALVGLFAAFSVQALFHFPLSIQASALVFWGAVGLASAWDEGSLPTPQPPPHEGGKGAPGRPGQCERGVDGAWMALPLGLGLFLAARQTLASAALNTGTLLKDRGQPVQALPFLHKAARLWPEDVRPWMRLGIAQDAAGDNEAAIDSFERASKVMPGLPEAWTNLGLALGKAGQLPEAQAVSEQALSLNPRSAEAWSNLAKLRYLQGDVKGALLDLQGGLAQAGPHALLYFNLGAIYLNSGQKPQAREAFEQCLRLQPEHAEAKRLLQGLPHAR